MPRQRSQGLHVDPQALPEPHPSTWNADQQDAWAGAEMAVLRAALALDGAGVRDSVLGELAEYHGQTIEEAYGRCIHWEQSSIEEWKAGDRSTPQGVRDFYETVASWRYDLAWYGYLQATGHAFPQSVALVRYMKARNIAGDLLDFGSGIGLNAQVFHRFGYRTTIADVSTPLLDFAVWRCARHGDDIAAINLNHAAVGEALYDVVTAFDVLVHVTDFDATARELHRAIRPGGWLFANFDTRAKDEASSWHLYDNDIDLDRRLKRAGFVRRDRIGGFLGCYQRVESAGLAHGLRTLCDRLTAPLEQARAFSRRIRWPTPTRVMKLAAMLRPGT